MRSLYTALMRLRTGNQKRHVKCYTLYGIHRAKEEFDSEFGKMILKKLGIEGDYEGIGHCALGYAAEPAKEAAPRK